jgi:1-acyl-sn-glycerol-3-phosphate acyltransferase
MPERVLARLMADEVDHRGEELPALTKRSSNVNLERILKFHKPDFSDRSLMTPGFWPLIRAMLLYGYQHVLRNVHYHYHGKDPSDGPGVLAVSWHTAGLIDPIPSILKIDKRFVFAGRQDVLTGPIIGWWGRRMGVQPLLRQAERQRGHVDDETANRVNRASMLTVASKLAHGHASVLMPEGHSHSEWHVIRFRTGPMRSALNAAALARELGNEPPVILPVGLTFRDPHARFTDLFVEYAEPLRVPELPDAEHGARLLAGEWVEPDKETTIKVRDEIRDRLGSITPDAPDLDTWRAWLLLGQLDAQSSGSPCSNWQEEVLAARSVRDRMRSSSGRVWQGPEACGEEDLAATSEVTLLAREAAATLHEMNLDGRATNRISSRILFPKTMLSAAALTAILFLAPVVLLGNGLQWLVGALMARYNGEAIDKRTTFHMMPTVLGTVFVRPLVHLASAAALLYYHSQTTVILSDIFPSAIEVYPVFLLAMFIVVWAFTDVCTIFFRELVGTFIVDVRRDWRTLLARRSPAWKPLQTQLDGLTEALDALK